VLYSFAYPPSSMLVAHLRLLRADEQYLGGVTPVWSVTLLPRVIPDADTSSSTQNWTFELEADHEVVSITPQTLGTLLVRTERQYKILMRLPAGQVASLGRVLGSRSTLLKYLNPDLVAIVSFSAPSSSASIALVDSVTGAVSFTVDQIHQVDERSNIQVLLRDNWLLYSYRLAGDVARTTQIVSIELYRSQAVYTPR
jgi:hypothetical protein